MTTKFMFIHNGDKSKEYMLARNCIRAGAAKVRRDADWITYHVGLEGHNVGIARTFKGAKSRAKNLLRTKPLGNTIRIAAKKNGEGQPVDTVYFHKVDTMPPVHDGPGVLGIDRAEAYVKNTFPHARFAGDCVCKSTTSGGHSDHADCAAVDYFDSWENMGKMKNEFINHADYYNTKYVILADRIYFPGGRSEHYSGVYHSHMHLSVNGGRYNSAC